jgi:hypothetical protein
MSLSQPGILAPVPSFSRYLEFGAVRDMDPAIGLRHLASQNLWVWCQLAIALT